MADSNLSWRDRLDSSLGNCWEDRWRSQNSSDSGHVPVELAMARLLSPRVRRMAAVEAGLQSLGCVPEEHAAWSRVVCGNEVATAKAMASEAKVAWSLLHS